LWELSRSLRLHGSWAREFPVGLSQVVGDPPSRSIKIRKFKHALAFYYSTLVTLKTCTATRRSTFSTLMSHLSHLVNYLKSTLQNFPLAFVDHVASFPHAVQIHAATPGHRRASSTLQRSQGRIPRSRRASRTYTRGLLHARRAFDGVLGACVRQHASSAPLTRYARVIETPPSPSLPFDTQY
jgi:hypothetical protein